MEAPPFGAAGPTGRTPDEVWWLSAAEGVRLRGALWRAEPARGHVVFLTGRTEFLEKVTLPAAAFVDRGWSVASLDWRGQGLSDRATDNRLKGHVSGFGAFQQDLDALLSDPRVSALPGPRLLVAHSMGGTIACAALARPEIAETVTAAILSAPMLGIRMGPGMGAAAWVTTKVGLGLGRAEAWPPMGDVETPYMLSDPSDNVLTQDPRVWDWLVGLLRDQPDLALAMPTIGWFDAAFGEMRRLRTLGPSPCPMLCLIGSNERVVDQSAVQQGALRLVAELVEIAGAEHELLIEREDLREQAWTAIDAFLSAHGLAD